MWTQNQGQDLSPKEGNPEPARNGDKEEAAISSTAHEGGRSQQHNDSANSQPARRRKKQYVGTHIMILETIPFQHELF